jgi:hypothetical protein
MNRPPQKRYGFRADYRHPVGPYCIGDPGAWYNGFSWEERIAASPIQTEAVKRGRIRKPAVCGLSGFTRPDDPNGWGYIFMHNEDYSRPLSSYALSRTAHYALHSRFTDPLRWTRLVRRHYRHGAWFTLLTMDPADMRRPFEDTYPIGLPVEGELWPDVADELGLSAQSFPNGVHEIAREGFIAWNLFHARSVTAQR